MSNPTDQQYAPTTEQHQPPSVHQGPGGSLPFTGYDFGVLGLAAVVLFASAAVLRRLAKTRGF